MTLYSLAAASVIFASASAVLPAAATTAAAAVGCALPELSGAAMARRAAVAWAVSGPLPPRAQPRLEAAPGGRGQTDTRSKHN